MDTQKAHKNDRKRVYLFVFLAVFFFILGTIGAVLLIRGQNNNRNQTQLNTFASPSPVEEFLTVLEGVATITRENQSHTAFLNQNNPLLQGDVITTREQSIAVIHFDNDNSTRIGPNSNVQINSDKVSLKLNQGLGSLYIRFTKILGKSEDFTVETSTTLATVRGTKFAVFTNDIGTKLIALDHEIEITRIDPVSKLPLLESLQILEGNSYAVINQNDKDILKYKIDSPDPKNPITHEEIQWLKFNEQLNLQTDNSNIGTLTLQLFSSPTPSPIPTQTPKPSPSVTPKPIITTISNMPGVGYSRSSVKTEAGNFTMSCIGANKNSVRVISDSGNDGDCKDNCTVLPLHEYATRNGGFAAMNGMYFCPADYPSCDGKKNSFDTLFFNSRVKRYLNSDNNVYSVLPFVVIESSGNARFMGKTLEWGRDTGIQAGTAGNPLLMHNGSYVAESQPLDDKQRNVKSNRGAIVQNGDLLYLCTVSGATVPDAGKVYKALNANNAMNIDGGGSTAMWLNGSYIYGPGRNIPTAIVFVRK